MDSYDFSMIFMSETQNVGQVDWKQLGLVNSNLKNADSYVGFFGPKKLDQVRVIRYQETLSVPNLESNEYKIFYLTPVWKLNSEHSGAAWFWTKPCGFVKKILYPIGPIGTKSK